MKILRLMCAGVAFAFCSAAGASAHMPPMGPSGLNLEIAGEIDIYQMPAHASSACSAHRAWIETQVALGRNAMAIYQELVEQYGFTHRYNSVKRFVRTLRQRDPERFDVLESAPGEEAQVDFGQGALTLSDNGKYRRPHLFVMTLKYSGKSFRKVVWKAAKDRNSKATFRAVYAADSCRRGSGKRAAQSLANDVLRF